MYEDLVKALREHADKMCVTFKGIHACGSNLALEAADAIETLIGKVKYLIERCDMADKNCAEAVHLGALWKEAALEQKPCWIHVAERLPEKYQYAVCWVNDEENKRGFYGIGSLSRIGDWYVDGDDYSENGNLHVTHWMPLPEPPKEGET